MHGVNADTQAAMSRFLSTMRTNHATVRFVSSGSDLQLTRKQLNTAYDRFRALPARANTEEMIGTFGGALPYRRTFDFKPDNADVPIFGKIDDQIDVDTLLPLVKRKCRVTLKVTARPSRDNVSKTYRLLAAAAL